MGSHLDFRIIREEDIHPILLGPAPSHSVDALLTCDFLIMPRDLRNERTKTVTDGTGICMYASRVLPSSNKLYRAEVKALLNSILPSVCQFLPSGILIRSSLAFNESPDRWYIELQFGCNLGVTESFIYGASILSLWDRVFYMYPSRWESLWKWFEISCIKVKEIEIRMLTTVKLAGLSYQRCLESWAA